MTRWKIEEIADRRGRFGGRDPGYTRAPNRAEPIGDGCHKQACSYGCGGYEVWAFVGKVVVGQTRKVSTRYHVHFDREAGLYCVKSRHTAHDDYIKHKSISLDAAILFIVEALKAEMVEAALET